jgi:hypothetical protein
MQKSKVGKIADVGKIMFRETEDMNPSIIRSYRWYVWHIGGPTSDIGRLTKETRKIDIGLEWSNENILGKKQGIKSRK